MELFLLIGGCYALFITGKAIATNLTDVIKYLNAKEGN